MIVSRIHGPPAICQVDLKPGAEVHRRVRRGYPNIPQVSRYIARGYVERAAESYCKVLKVAAHPDPLGKHIEGGLGGAGMLIAKSHLGIDPVADGADPAPARSDIAKKLHGDIGEPVDLAITAVEQVNQRLVGQIRNRMLCRVE